MHSQKKYRTEVQRIAEKLADFAMEEAKGNVLTAKMALWDATHIIKNKQTELKQQESLNAANKPRETGVSDNKVRRRKAKLIRSSSK